MNPYLHGVDVLGEGNLGVADILPRNLGTGDDVFDDILGVILGEQTVPQAVTYVDKPTVTLVQQALKNKGADLGKSGPNHDGVDGSFGSKTAAAIRTVQQVIGLPVTGAIDAGVLAALNIPAPTTAPSRTNAGSSASAAAQDVANTATNAAAEADKADTASGVQDAAAAVQAASTASPPAPAAVQAEAARAAAKAKAARTPAEIKEAGAAVAAAGDKVAAAAGQTFWGSPAWRGAPMKRWQAAVGGFGIGAVVLGITATLLKRRR